MRSNKKLILKNKPFLIVNLKMTEENWRNDEQLNEEDELRQEQLRLLNNLRFTNLEPKTDILLFNKWGYNVNVPDRSLKDYICVKQKVFIPHTAGRYASKRFRKAVCPIVERLTNSLMMKGRNNGKKLMAVRIVKHAFEIIHLLTGENPLQIFVQAVINGGPREDSTRVGSAGVVRRQAVDVSPLRRVNLAIYFITQGARSSAFRSIKTIAECLADEIINCSKEIPSSYAIKQKVNIEKQAISNR